ncbi:hypothetical protein F8M41_017233 [Gigaspora margarita]|uniref:Secreted protein n=1 Tax=Gigaspora margarita TaxID=4874 RepID=A0A8H4EM94_GIGMA|nr:hypothetical protein F8M41_017233 [Gigaspora margarita]
MRYGKSYGLLYTVLALAMETETDEEVNNYAIDENINHNENIFQDKSINHNESINHDENIFQDESIIQDENTIQDEYVQVTNPKVIATKGQPSGRQKSVLELEDRRPLKTIEENYNQQNNKEISKNTYTCSNYHIKGHNIRSYNLLKCTK